jgi:acyl transferase domain-containing protein/acyl carrier protein
MSCRFPGGANTPSQFWNNLAKGQNCIGPVPETRWDREEHFDENIRAFNKMTTKWGGFLSEAGIRDFDAKFFRISDKEARNLDPQQRLLLESNWEALENAGIDPHTLAGSKTGVFVGISTTDYFALGISDSKNVGIDAYVGTGYAHSVAAGRISYFLNLNGPCLPVDTACSSSLVALHLALQSLANDECQMALVSGVNVLLDPRTTVYFSKLGVMSKSGRCRAFDKGADGYVRSEGVATLVLKPLSAAQREGNPIHAIIRGSAINHVGSGKSITTPSMNAQRDVILDAYQAAQLKMEDIDYLEAHGTGTVVGDAAEAAALVHAFKGRKRQLLIGSVKTNIGHLEAVSGLAGLIKVVLALKYKTIPPHLHFDEVNPNLSWNHDAFAIPTSLVPWPRYGKKRVAAISSFGFNGTNAHVVLEEAPDEVLSDATAKEGEKAAVLCLSARNLPALEQLRAQYLQYLPFYNGTLEELCYSAAVGRAQFSCRISIMARSIDELNDKLADSCWPVVEKKKDADSSCDVHLVLPDGIDGPFWQELGAFYLKYPVMQQEIKRCLSLIKKLGGHETARDLQSQLQESKGSHPDSDSGSLRAVRDFILTSALTQVWLSWGVKPKMLTGTGVGRLVAGSHEGALTTKEALSLMLEFCGCSSGDKVPSLRQHSLKMRRRTRSARFAQLNPRSEVDQFLLHKLADDLCCDTPSVVPVADGEGGLYIAIAPTHHEVSPLDHALSSGPAWTAAMSSQLLPNSTCDDICKTIALLGTHGCDFNWRAFYDNRPSRKRVELPFYPFQRSSYWYTNKMGSGERTAPKARANSSSALIKKSELVFERFLHAKDPCMKDHVILGNAVFPASGYITLLVESLTMNGRFPGYSIEGLVPSDLLRLGCADQIMLHLEYFNPLDKVSSFAVSSSEKAALLKKRTHLTGMVTKVLHEPVFGCPEELVTLKARLMTTGRAVTQELFYSLLRDHNLEYGPNFQWVNLIWAASDEALVFLTQPASVAREDGLFQYHPGLLDGCFQALGFISGGRDNCDLFIPVGLKKITFHGEAHGGVWCYVKRNRQAWQKDGCEGDMWLWNNEGRPILEARGVALRQIPCSMLQGLMGKRLSELLYRPSWSLLAAAEQSPAAERQLTYFFYGAESDASQALRDCCTHQGVSYCDSTDADAMGRYVNGTGQKDFVYILTSKDMRCFYAEMRHLLELSKMLQNSPQKARVTLVTQGAVKVHEADRISPFQAAAMAFFKVLGNEASQLQVNTVDMDPELFIEEQLPHMRTFLERTAPEKFVAVRKGRFFGSRLRPVKKTENFDATASLYTLDPHESYLVTGAHGDLGIRVVSLLVSLGAQNLILLGRREPDLITRALWDDYEKKGVKIITLALDVANYDELKLQLTRILPQGASQVRGIIHLAGTVDDDRIAHLDWERFHEVLRPKIEGTCNLHRLFKNDDLQFFVTFSSVSAQFGTPGQSAYAAANAFMDAFIQSRNDEGLTGVSLLWGPWSGLGMAKKLSASHFENFGIVPLSVGLARQALHLSLCGEKGNLLCAELNAPKLSTLLGGALFTELHADNSVSENRSAKRTTEQILTELAEASSTRQHEIIAHELITAICHILEISDSSGIDERATFYELGIDSITGFELLHHIEDELGFRLPPALIFTSISIAEAVEMLLDEWRKTKKDGEPAATLSIRSQPARPEA